MLVSYQHLYFCLSTKPNHFDIRENTVASCMKCNGKKGSLTVSELNAVGMKLRKEPFTPTQYQLHKIAGKMVPKDIHPSWSPYL